jgi:GT2 family glycosyltransferase
MLSVDDLLRRQRVVMHDETELLSILIVTWNSGRAIGACLESVLSHTRSVPAEVIVVDNGSADGTADLVGRNFPRVILIRNRSNIGYARAMNIGLKRASGGFVLLFNPDSLLLPGSAERMVAELKRDPGLGALGPQLLDSGGSIQPSCREFPSYQIVL